MAENEPTFPPPSSQLTNRAAEILDDVVHTLNPSSSVKGIDDWKPYIDKVFVLLDKNIKVYHPYADGIINKKYFVGADELRRIIENSITMGYRNGGITNFSVHPTGQHSAIATFYQRSFLRQIYSGNHPRMVQIRLNPDTALITELEETWHSAALLEASRSAALLAAFQKVSFQ